MREHLLKLLSDRALPGTSPSEDYFSAGPPPAAKQQLGASKHEALIADLRGRRRRARRSVAA